MIATSMTAGAKHVQQEFEIQHRRFGDTVSGFPVREKAGKGKKIELSVHCVRQQC